MKPGVSVEPSSAVNWPSTARYTVGGSVSVSVIVPASGSYTRVDWLSNAWPPVTRIVESGVSPGMM